MKNITRLLNALMFKNHPIYIHYGITHRCNLRCRMCNIYQEANESEELSMAQIETIFEHLRRLGVVYVSIGGGEPFLRNDLSSVIKLLRKKGLMVRLLTNGTITDECTIRNLASVGLREVSISLDTLNPQKQAYICNYEGTWEKTTRSIELFSDILPKNNRLLIINTVVSPLNIQELPQLSHFAKEKGYYISFIPIEANGNSEFAFTQNEHGWIDESYDYLMRAKKKGKSTIFNSSEFLEKSRQYLKGVLRNWRCDAGRLYFSLNPKGEISICHRFKHGISFFGANLKMLLASEEFKKERESLIKTCPGCMRPCWSEISLLMSDKRSLWEMLKIKIAA